MMLKVVNMPNDDPQGPDVTTPDSPEVEPMAGATAPSDSAGPTPTPTPTAAPASGPPPPPVPPLPPVPPIPPVPPAPVSASATRSTWTDRLSNVAGWLGGYLRSPRTRLGVVGIILLLAGIVWITNSVWTLPLIIVGIAMVVIAWVGSRLDGRFAIEWGEGGTQVEFRAQIKPPPPVVQPVRLSPIPSAPARLRTPARSEVERSDVIEGEGHTVEIDVAELKTLIRAAEAAEATARGGTASDTSQRRPAA